MPKYKVTLFRYVEQLQSKTVEVDLQVPGSDATTAVMVATNLDRGGITAPGWDDYPLAEATWRYDEHGHTAHRIERDVLLDLHPNKNVQIEQLVGEIRRLRTLYAPIHDIASEIVEGRLILDATQPATQRIHAKLANALDAAANAIPKSETA